MANELTKYLNELRKIEKHRDKKTEKEIRKLYQQMLKEVRSFLGETYAKYAKDDKLTYELLSKQKQYAYFLNQVEQSVSGLSTKVRNEIRSAVEESYAHAYDYMVEAVLKADNIEELRELLEGLHGVPAETIKRAVENPIAGLTLNDTLEKSRATVIYNIKKQIGIGLTNGDRYSTMAKRIKTTLQDDYKKAIVIARTETHRVREAGNHDAAKDVNDTLKAGNATVELVKTWKTMKDERVRSTHSDMEGVTIPVDDEFELPSGATTLAPSQSGVASEDINCRCYLSYSLQKVKG